MRLEIIGYPLNYDEFQSSPDQLVGCDQLDVDTMFQSYMFQSSPDQLVGCDGFGDPGLAFLHPVSILTRSASRVRLDA